MQKWFLTDHTVTNLNSYLITSAAHRIAITRQTAGIWIPKVSVITTITAWPCVPDFALAHELASGVKTASGSVIVLRIRTLAGKTSLSQQGISIVATSAHFAGRSSGVVSAILAATIFRLAFLWTTIALTRFYRAQTISPCLSSGVSFMPSVIAIARILTWCATITWWAVTHFDSHGFGSPILFRTCLGSHSDIKLYSLQLSHGGSSRHVGGSNQNSLQPL